MPHVEKAVLKEYTTSLAPADAYDPRLSRAFFHSIALSRDPTNRIVPCCTRPWPPLVSGYPRQTRVCAPVRLPAVLMRDRPLPSPPIVVYFSSTKQFTRSSSTTGTVFHSGVCRGNRSTTRSEGRLVSGQRYRAQGLLCCSRKAEKDVYGPRRSAAGRQAHFVDPGSDRRRWRNVDAHCTRYRQELFGSNQPRAASESRQAQLGNR